MKTVCKLLAIALIIVNFSCSKDEAPAPIVDTKLVLPAILENNTALIIPDCTQNGTIKNPGSASNTIEITGDGIISDPSKITLELDLTHPFSGDVVVELVPPSGENCGIIKRIGSTTDTSSGSPLDFVLGNKLKFNSLHTTFLLPQVSTSFVTGKYAPSRGLSSIPFSVPMIEMNTFFMGKNIKGIWTIKIYDFNVLDIGKLNSWKLYFDAGALQ